MWSLYLSDDLGGTRHGFNKLQDYLIKDSYMWKIASNWASNVDINFVSNHILLNPTFTNTNINNCTIYNNLACDVYLEKNMKVGKTSWHNKTDILNDRFYFIYYDNTWKLINMKAIVKE